MAAAAQSPHYDIVEDMGNQRANITFHQLLEDNKTYCKMLMLSLRRSCKPCTVKLPGVYHVMGEDLRPPEMDVEIGGCTLLKVPVDCGSGVNIMTEEVNITPWGSIPLNLRCACWISRSDPQNAFGHISGH